MAAMSDYLRNKTIDFIFRGFSFTAPTTLAFALCTSAPTAASTGATIPELANSGSYARATLNPSATNWAPTQGGTGSGASSGTNGTTSNNVVITFPTATADWSGTITYVAIVDSATYGAGNVFYWGSLTSSKSVSNGDVFSFQLNELSVQLL